MSDRVQQNDQSSYRRGVTTLIVVCIIIAFLYMLPRLLNARFGLFDDGGNINIFQTMQTPGWDSFELDRGRFRPAYWYFWYTLYFLGGQNPVVFFLGNTALLASILVLYGISLYRWTSRWTVGIVSVLFLLLFPSTIELFYTLSKGEGLQIFWILLAITLAQSSREKAISAIDYWLLPISVALLAACLSKETSVIVLPLFTVVFTFPSFLKKSNARKFSKPIALRLMLAAFIAVPTYLLWRAALVNTGFTETARYNLSVSTFLDSLFRWGGFLLSDFPYLVFLPPALIILCKRLDRSEWEQIILSVIWMLAWIVVFLPWSSMTVYFQFPFSLGLAFLMSITVHALINHGVVHSRSSIFESRMLLILMGVGIFLSTGNTISNARIQVSSDVINHEMLFYVAESLPANSVLLVNFQDPNEYYGQVVVRLRDFYHREDLIIDYVDLASFPPVTEDGLYVLTPYASNIPVITVRTGVTEPYISIWIDRLLEHAEPGLDLIVDLGVEMELFIVKLPRIICPLLNAPVFCSGDYGFMDRLDYSYGWRLYQYVH